MCFVWQQRFTCLLNVDVNSETMMWLGSTIDDTRSVRRAQQLQLFCRHDAQCTFQMYYFGKLQIEMLAVAFTRGTQYNSFVNDVDHGRDSMWQHSAIVYRQIAANVVDGTLLETMNWSDFCSALFYLANDHNNQSKCNNNNNKTMAKKYLCLLRFIDGRSWAFDL